MLFFQPRRQKMDTEQLRDVIQAAIRRGEAAFRTAREGAEEDLEVAKVFAMIPFCIEAAAVRNRRYATIVYSCAYRIPGDPLEAPPLPDIPGEERSDGTLGSPKITPEIVRLTEERYRAKRAFEDALPNPLPLKFLTGASRRIADACIAAGYAVEAGKVFSIPYNFPRLYSLFISW